MSDQKTLMMEETPGQTSWMRKHLSFYFWLIAVPGSWVMFAAFLLKTENPTIESGIVYAIIISILHIGWQAPKIFQKIVEKASKKL